MGYLQLVLSKNVDKMGKIQKFLNTAMALRGTDNLVCEYVKTECGIWAVSEMGKL